MERRTVIVIVALIAIVLFGFIVFGLIWGWSSSSNEGGEGQTVPLSSPVGFLYRCRDFECDDGYACDSVAQVCKKNNGQPCGNAYDCLNGAVCSGICIVGTPGVFSGEANSPCPCGSGMTCVTIEDGTRQKVCKLNAGRTCQDDRDCLSNFCQSGVCSPGQPLGGECTQDSQCVTGSLCSLGFCQLSGIATGQEGAVCNVQGEPSCDSGLSCVNQICTAVTQGLSQICNTTSQFCISPLLCLNVDSFAPCQGAEESCQCAYPYTEDSSFYRPDPNSCESTSACSGGFICSSGNCLALSETPCSISSQCQSSSCNAGQGGIFSLLFTYNDQSTVPAAPVTNSNPVGMLSSYDLGYRKVSSGTVPSSISSLTGYSSSSGDQLFYVVPGVEGSSGTGLIDMRGNVRLQGVSQSSSGGVQTTTLLVDALVDQASGGLISYNQIQVDQATGALISSVYLLYSYNPSTDQVVPANVTSGAAGTQFDGSGNALDILQISRSLQGDVLIFDGTLIYVRSASMRTYTVLTNSADGTTTITGASQPQYYFDVGQGSTGSPPNSPQCVGNCLSYLNVGYVASYTDTQSSSLPIAKGSLLQFNGNIRGVVMPFYVNTSDIYNVNNYSVYSDPQYGIQNGYVTLIATNQNIGRTLLFVVPYGTTEVIPSYVSGGAKVLSLSSGAYLYSSGLCS